MPTLLFGSAPRLVRLSRFPISTASNMPMLRYFAPIESKGITRGGAFFDGLHIHKIGEAFKKMDRRLLGIELAHDWI
jgi:hypothetical protein